ncbi:hypothetical protein ACWDKQ_15320 [Saccharopolyspora sp. NPDC000995]
MLATVDLPATIDLLRIDIEGVEADALAGIDDHDWARTRQSCSKCTTSPVPRLPCAHRWRNADSPSPRTGRKACSAGWAPRPLTHGGERGTMRIVLTSLPYYSPEPKANSSRRPRAPARTPVR